MAAPHSPRLHPTLPSSRIVQGILRDSMLLPNPFAPVFSNIKRILLLSLYTNNSPFTVSARFAPSTYRSHLRSLRRAAAIMPPKSAPPEFSTKPFPTAADFEAFLEREHTNASGIFVKLAKKSSGMPSITAAEAVEVALCYGWIDGRANSIDETWWTVRYTPRRAKSIWSQKNVGTIARLIDEGRMRPAGLVAVDAAKADGRWDRAYPGPATIVVPEDLKTALAEVPAAEALWESMNKSERYATLLKIENGAQTGRPKRIQIAVQTLAAGRRLGITPAKVNRTAVSERGHRVQKSSTSGKPAAPKLPTREGLRQRKT